MKNQYWIAQSYLPHASTDFRRTPLMETVCFGSTVWYLGGIVGVLLLIFT